MSKDCCENLSRTPCKQKDDLCPICGTKGELVQNVTVKHMLIGDDSTHQIGSCDYYLCMNDACDISYYNIEHNKYFKKEQVKVPIWFKKDAAPKYACYCSRVTEEEVIEAVVKHGARTVKDVNTITGAMKNANCKENNPLGVCCHKVIEEAIAKGLDFKDGK